jgi:hypothetical protein
MLKTLAVGLILPFVTLASWSIPTILLQTFCIGGVSSTSPTSIMSLALNSRPAVRQGDFLPLELDAAPLPSLQTGYAILFDVSDFRIDGKPMVYRPTAEQMATYLRHQGLIYVSSEHGGGPSDFPVPVDGAITRQLSIGTHRIDATLHLYRYKEDAFEWDADGHLQPAGSRSKAPAQAFPPLPTTEDMKVSTAFAVCDNAHEPPLVMTDGKLRDAVRSSIIIKLFSADQSKPLCLDVFFKNPPVAFNFVVLVQPSENTAGAFNVNGAICEAQSTAAVMAYGNLPAGQPTTVDVTFRPDSAAARQSVDASPIWGEDVVFHNVPITFKQTGDGP